MTELAKDEAELLDAMVDAIWDHLMPETRWTCKPYVERDLRAAIRGAGWVVVPAAEQDTLRAENARLRDALKDAAIMIEACYDAPKNPDSLPQMLLHHIRAALAGEVKP